MKNWYMIQHRINPSHTTLYLMLASDGALCWTVDGEKAERFPSAEAANAFAAERIAGDVYVRAHH